MKYIWISSEIKPDTTGFYHIKTFDEEHNNTTYDIAYYDEMLDTWSIDDGLVEAPPTYWRPVIENLFYK